MSQKREQGKTDSKVGYTWLQKYYITMKRLPDLIFLRLMKMLSLGTNCQGEMREGSWMVEEESISKLKSPIIHMDDLCKIKQSW